MNARIVFATIALALPLLAQAESPIPSTDPVTAIAPASTIKSCANYGRHLLRPGDVARGLGRAWSDDMAALRRNANRQAEQICDEGALGVKFTFIRSQRGQDMAIAVGREPRIAAVP